MGLDATRVVEFGVGILGLLAILTWVGFLLFLVSVGEIETTVVLLMVTILGLVVIGRDAMVS